MEHLRPYASAKQEFYLDAVLKHGSNNKAAKALGIGRRTIDQAMKRLRAKAAEQGDSPAHDMVHTVPDGYMVKGVSTYYDDQGNKRGQWVKSTKRDEDLQQAFINFALGFVDDLPQSTPVSRTSSWVSEDLLTCYIIGDHHLGMLVDSYRNGIAGGDWNIARAQQVLTFAVDKLVHSSPDAHTGLLVNLGDFLHTNGEAPLTQSGNVLDVDKTFAEAFTAAGAVIKTVIHRMLEKHEKVVVMNARGNHDRDSALMLNILLQSHYANDPRVEVIDNVRKLVTYSFGKNLIAAHHGDKMKPQQMYEQITRDYSKAWGESEYRYGLMGHIHHQSAKEIGGMTFSSWGVLASTDAWHSDSGYGSERSMSCIVMHREYGEDVRYKVSIKEIDDEIKQQLQSE